MTTSGPEISARAEPAASVAADASAAPVAGPFPAELILHPLSRWPTTLWPATVETVLTAARLVARARYDVLAFPLLADDARFAPLHQLLRQFAQQGHRVFELHAGAGTADSPECLPMQVLEPSLFAAELAAGAADPWRRLSGEQEERLLAALDAFRRVHAITTAVVYVSVPAWLPVALRARDRWDWKVVYASLESAPAAPRVPAPDLERWQRIDAARRATFKRASILILTYNNLVYTRLCLESLLANTDYPNYEIIIVDNGSTDDTPRYLRELAEHHPHIDVTFNAENRGFAGGNNQALARASGDVLVLLNNDTLVSRGWLTRLIHHLRDSGVGAVGPVTNQAGNEAQIETDYNTYGEFVQFAAAYSTAHDGETFAISSPIMFCLALRRDVYERVGPLDERFEVGLFEDADYALRIGAAGYQMLCAEDVYIHHYGQASIGGLAATGEYDTLFEANRARLEAKWGTTWQPYHRRPQALEFGRRFQALVIRTLPPTARVAVVSQGEPRLLKLDGRQAWHFPPPGAHGAIPYYYTEAAAAISQLALLRAEGADYLAVPCTAAWWIDYAADFKRHLETEGRLVVDEPGLAQIFALHEGAYSVPLAPEDCKVAISAALPTVMEADTVVALECVLENLGAATFPTAPPHAVRLAYRWIEGDSGQPLADAAPLYSHLPRPPAPGVPLICPLQLRTPATEGHFVLRLTLAQEGVAWFDDLHPENAWQQPVRVVRASHEPVPPAERKIQVQADLPTELDAGAVVDLECTIHNLGAVVLPASPPRAVHLSYRWVIPGSGGRSLPGTEARHTRLPGPLPPDAQVRCRFGLKAPAQVGEVILRVTLIQEGAGWFDKLDAANAAGGRVRIRPPAAADGDRA